MIEVTRDHSYRQRDAWLSIFTCYLIQIVVAFLFVPILHNLFPSLSRVTLYFCLPILSALIPISFLGHRYGWIHLSDLWPRGSDYLVLLVAIFILFIRFSLVALRSPYTPGDLSGQTISQLPRLEYFLVFLAAFLYGPFLEELLLRKYVFEIFRNKFNVVLAIGLTAFCGTLLHIDFEQSVTALVKTFIYSAFYTLVYLKSRLGGSVFIHGLTNFLIYYTWWR